MSSEVIASIDGRPVTVWNSASSGKPSDERVRSSVDAALAALEGYVDKRDRDHAVSVLHPDLDVVEVEG